MGWVVNATPQPLYPQERPGTHYIEAGWAPGPVRTVAENLAPNGSRLPALPAHSKLLYRLRYSGPSFRWVQTWISTVLLCSVKSAVLYCHLTGEMSIHHWLGTHHKISAHDVFDSKCINPYPTAFPYGNGMVLHFYQQQESSTTKTVHKVINKGLKAYV